MRPRASSPAPRSLTGAGSRLLGTAAKDVAASRRAVRLPTPAEPLGAVPGGVSLPVPGLTPFRTGNSSFYRVDTALSVPQLTTRAWRLRVHGMVDHELSLSFDELLAQPLVERLITLTCVSNEVGGNLIGNAVWLGYPLKDLLSRAGTHSDADMVLSTSVDGMTISTPLAELTDGRDAMLAVAMNGTPLPVEHGFPVRMVVPGLYGYVSATKWVVDLEVTRFDKKQAYWTPRGYAAKAPIKTSSRIDVPGSFAHVKAGTVAVAGVAWAQHRGINSVQVRVDGGTWHDARLADSVSKDTWRQWVWQWPAAAWHPHHRVPRRGRHRSAADLGLPRPTPRWEHRTGLSRGHGRLRYLPAGCNRLPVDTESPNVPTTLENLMKPRLILTALAATGLTLGAAACGSSSGGSSAGSAGGSSTTTTSSPTSSSDAAMTDLVGPGCAAYAQAVPSGSGSVDGMSQSPVATAASNNPLLKTLVAAVSGQLNPKVNLVNTLNNGQFTVFAPVDTAFAKVPAATLGKLKTDAPLLTKILTYHVVAGQLSPSQVVGMHKTVEGGTVDVTGSGQSLKVDGANVVCGGVHTANATVYLIDSVLNPKS